MKYHCSAIEWVPLVCQSVHPWPDAGQEQADSKGQQKLGKPLPYMLTYLPHIYLLHVLVKQCGYSCRMVKLLNKAFLHLRAKLFECWTMKEGEKALPHAHFKMYRYSLIQYCQQHNHAQPENMNYTMLSLSNSTYLQCTSSSLNIDSWELLLSTRTICRNILLH